VIATVRFTLHGEPARAQLSDALVWSASAPVVTDSLNALLSAEDRTPDLGRWVDSHVMAVAKTLGGTVIFEPRKRPPAGRIY
jgi:hypothetical protein